MKLKPKQVTDILDAGGFTRVADASDPSHAALDVDIGLDAFSASPEITVALAAGPGGCAPNPARLLAETGARPPVHRMRTLVKNAGCPGEAMVGLAAAVERLHELFARYDLLDLSIDGLHLADKTACYRDAAMDMDENALYRHPEFKPDPVADFANEFEREAAELGLAYVDLEGEIGVVASGAGLGMATMDIIRKRYRPANFLETGGGMTEEGMYQIMRLVLKKPGLRAVFINIYGGVNPIHEGARGVVRAMRDFNVTIPVFAKALGNRQEETWEIFRQGGVRVVESVRTEDGIEEMFAAMEGA